MNTPSRTSNDRVYGRQNKSILNDKRSTKKKKKNNK